LNIRGPSFDAHRGALEEADFQVKRQPPKVCWYYTPDSRQLDEHGKDARQGWVRDFKVIATLDRLDPQNYLEVFATFRF
jgi:hypothetical protein